MKNLLLRLIIVFTAFGLFTTTSAQTHERTHHNRDLHRNIQHNVQQADGVTLMTQSIASKVTKGSKNNLIDEDFSSGTFPPEGWSIIGEGMDNWIISETNGAGGEAPEAKMHWAPVFDGNSKLASLPVNTSDLSSVGLSFNHILYDYASDYTIKVETSSDGTNWNEVWSIYVTNSIGPEEVLIGIENADVGSENFQLAFTFEGNTDFTDGWAIDDVKLYETFENDVSTTAIMGFDAINNLGVEIIPAANVFNNGSETATFDAVIRINDGTTDVYTSSATVTDLGFTEEETLTFDSWTTTVEGEFTAYVTTMLDGDENPDNDEMSFSFIVMDGVLLYQNFANGIDSWEVMGDGSGNWNVKSTDYAGGSAPELEFGWSPVFEGLSRFVSPTINTSAYTELSLDFRHYLDYYLGGYNLKIETTSDGGTTWNEIWAIYDVQEGFDAEAMVFGFSNGDVGSETFQMAFTYEGNSDNINSWNIDDITLREPPQKDVSPYDMTGFVPMMNKDAEVTPGVSVINLSGAAASFDVKMTINNGSVDVYESVQTIEDLAGFEETTISFDMWTTEVGNMKATVITLLEGDANAVNDTVMYNFTVIDGIFRNMVIAEDFTGAWCGFCPGAAMGIDDLIHQGYDVAAVAFHNGDDYATEEAGVREDFYGITGFPTVKFDGVEEYIGGSTNQSMIDAYIPIIEQRMAMPTPLKVDIEDANFSGNTFTANVNIDPISTFPEGEMVLYAVITESHIAESWQTLFEMNFVDRAMFNGENGLPIDLTLGQQDIPIEFVLGDDWVPELCEVVVFVQHTATKGIFNADKVQVKEIESFADVMVTATDNSGVVIEGVLVHFGEFSELTNADGQAIFADVEPGPYLFSYGKEGYLPGISSMKVIRIDDLNIDVELLMANVIFAEDFSDVSSWPTPGWEITGNQPENWQISESFDAGGIAPELIFSWNPANIGESDFISPLIDLTGISNISLVMKNLVNNYTGETAEDYELFILASAGDGWNTIWSTIPQNIDAEILHIELDDEYITAGSIQIAFRFSGDTDKINNWSIDDVWIIEEIKTYAVEFSVYKMADEAPIADAIISIDGLADIQTDELGQATFNALPNGDYSYTIHAQAYNDIVGDFAVNGESLALNIEMEADGIEDLLASRVNIYPNPANDAVIITNLDKADIFVSSLTGQLLIHKDKVSGQYNLSLLELTNGTYIIQIKEGNELMTSKLSIVK